jgi:hypothetical protein
MGKNKLFKAAVKIASGLVSNSSFFNEVLDKSRSADEFHDSVAKSSLEIAEKIEEKVNKKKLT